MFQEAHAAATLFQRELYTTLDPNINIIKKTDEDEEKPYSIWTCLFYTGKFRKIETGRPILMSLSLFNDAIALGIFSQTSYVERSL